MSWGTLKKKPFQMKESVRLNRSKNIFFLMALPRSGNTLFASIMNQNPKIACTANSITLEIIKDVFFLKQTDVFKNYPDHESLDNVLSSVYYNYYKDWPQETIIDRGPAMTDGNLMLLKKHLDQPVKCIILWRDLLDVLASYIKWFENEPTAYPNQYGKKNIEEKLYMLMDDEGSIAKELKGIQNAIKPENQKHCFFIRYEDLVMQPEPTIKGIYEFLFSKSIHFKWFRL
jgi:hypothetical protein